MSTFNKKVTLILLLIGTLLLGTINYYLFLAKITEEIIKTMILGTTVSLIGIGLVGFSIERISEFYKLKKDFLTLGVYLSIGLLVSFAYLGIDQTNFLAPVLGNLAWGIFMASIVYLCLIYGYAWYLAEE